MLQVLLSFGIALFLLPGHIFPITLGGTVCRTDGQPLPATVSLTRLSYLLPPGNPVAGCQQSAEFQLAASVPGLYLLVVEADGYERLEIPVLLDGQEIKELRLFPRSSPKTMPPVPVCSDSRLTKWEVIHQAQCARHTRYDRGKKLFDAGQQKSPAPSPADWPIDWKEDLQALAQGISAEMDPPTKAFLAACYMDMESLGADLDSKMMPAMLVLLPGDSPFWGINFRSFLDMVNNVSPGEAKLFLTTMEERHFDPEVRAMAIFVKIDRAASEYDVDEWRRLFGKLVSQFPDTKAGKSAPKYYDPAKAFSNGQLFPSFQLKDFDGRELTLETFRGKVVLVDFWATWCPPCIKEFPGMHALYEKFKAGGFEILSLSIDSKSELVAEFRSGKWPMPWYHALLAEGRSHPLATALNVSTIPRAFLVGRDGRILECKRAALRGELLKQAVEKAMSTGPEPDGQ